MKEELRERITSMENIITSQETSQKTACECLARVQACEASARMINKVNGEDLSQEEQETYTGAIIEACDNINAIIASTAAMKQELHELRQELILNDRS